MARSTSYHFSRRLVRQWQAALAVALTLGISLSAAQAATIVKANNANDLNLTTSWTGAVVPGAGDIASWTSAVTAANTTNLGADTSWLGLSVVSPGGLVTINPGNTLTVGASGINLSGTASLTVNSPLFIGAGQQWQTVSGTTLTLGGTLTRAAGSLVNAKGAGTVSVAGTGLANDASGIVGPWLTIGSGSSTAYASVSGSNLVAYTGATAAATPSALSSATTNYDLAAGGALTSPATANTVRFTGATSQVIDLGSTGANDLQLNSVLTASSLGTADLTISRSGTSTARVLIGSTNQLLLNAGSGNIVISAPIADNGLNASSVIAGGFGGNVTLSGVNSYSGGTIVGGGTGTTVVAATNASAFGSGAVTVLNGGRVQFNALTYANVFNINGASALFVGNNQTGVVLNGAVNLQSNASVSNGSGNNSLTINNLNVGAFTFTSNYSGGSGDPIAINNISGSGGVFKSGNSNLTISGNNAATYSGTTTLFLGTLVLGNDGALGSGPFVTGNADQTTTIRSFDTAAHTFNNVVTFAGNANSIHTFGSGTASVNGNLTFSNTGAVSLGGQVKKFSVSNRTELDAAYSSGGINKNAGTGTLVLGGANTYTSATTAAAGTLLVNGSLSTASAVAVTTGGTFGGTGTVGAVTVASTGILAPGDGGIGTFGTTAVTLATGGALALELNTSLGTADLLNVSGALNLAGTNDSILTLALVGTDILTPGTNFTLANYGTWNGGLFSYLGSPLADDATFTLGLNTYRISYNGVNNLTSAITLSVAAVPEPSTYALLALGAVFVLIASRKRRMA